MKKRIMSIALALCLLAVAAMGTIAYFTDTDNDKNVFTFGSVEITQNEVMYKDGNFVDFEDGGVLLPMGNDTAWAAEELTYSGASFKVFDSDNWLSKIVTVTNDGDSDAYVRTIVAVEGNQKAWDENIAITDNVGTTSGVSYGVSDLYVTINGTEYIIVTYVYDEAVAANTTSVPSLTGVALYKETTQEDIVAFGDTYDVLVISQAVQAADMGTDAGAALDEAFGAVTETSVVEWFEAAFPVAP